MSLGIGLGAFTQGIKQGYGFGLQVDQVKRDRANRKAMEQIDTDARTQFDKEVSAGEREKDSFTDFYHQFVIPKKEAELLRQGDVSGAKAWREYAESDAATKGAKLFGGALTKANTGDYGGALDAAIEAAKVKGYLDHGYEISAKDEIVDPSGNLIGYRVTGTDNGKEFATDIPVDQVPSLVARLANPIAAFESQQARSKKDTETNEKARGAAIKALRKRMDGGLAGDEKSFDDVGRDEQEKLIADEIALQKGTTAKTATGVETPPKSVVVDKATGETMDPEASPAAPARETKTAKSSDQKQGGQKPDDRKPLPNKSGSPFVDLLNKTGLPVPDRFRSAIEERERNLDAPGIVPAPQAGPGATTPVPQARRLTPEERVEFYRRQGAVMAPGLKG